MKTSKTRMKIMLSRFLLPTTMRRLAIPSDLLECIEVMTLEAKYTMMKTTKDGVMKITEAMS